MNDLGLLLLRLGYCGLLIGLHGWTRFLRVFHHVVRGEPWTFVGVVEHIGFPFPSVFAVASALSESIGAALLVAGLFSRTVAVLLIINFGVATISEAAKGDPYEVPALYLLGAIVLAVTGPGRFSIDGTRAGRRKPGRRQP